MDTTGVLDEALHRLHGTGPEFGGWLSNHGPMAVEALVRHGQARTVHRWLDRYGTRLEDAPVPGARIGDTTWREALGDPRRLGDWLLHFDRLLAERPWRAVLAQWWPRLLPGIAGGATHPVIRVGHAVRTLREAEAAGADTGPGGGAGRNAPRLRELAHGLGYWAARHQPLPPALALRPGPDAAGDALRAVARVPDASGGVNHRLGQLTELPAWPRSTAPDDVPGRLGELVDEAVRYYAGHAHGDAVMLVHAATAPNAVLRTLPDLPHALWPASLAAAWSASAAVTAAYRPERAAAPGAPGAADLPELFERAAAHGDEHVIKLADTAADVAARHPHDVGARAAVVRAVELIDPL
ncbi:questin oxidase family protein [Streptomyces sp. TRM 70351]|uniref:questin oxidase family protein n=1 Tax=Streptomyces sp. TRM 70351 TaxID=3116552 RepID=UPI002E7C1B0A|nr:questin oxidase family protein [Streptomyces sp. TRM 70351]MEE1930970.1 questin oxidase family protein [Streptomyces sp. TRM 70351]